jgi:hypothetical protein
MFIGYGALELHLPYATDLKSKRRIVRGLVERCMRFGLSPRPATTTCQRAGSASRWSRRRRGGGRIRASRPDRRVGSGAVVIG